MSEQMLEERAQFTAMERGTEADWRIIATAMKPFQRALPDRVIEHLKLLGGDHGGYAVDRLEHSLQTATLAQRDGRDEEYVVCALLHDIGDMLGSANHSDIAAAVLKPFVSEANHWLVEKHGIFQGYYFFHYLGLDRDMRETYRGHEYFVPTADFCEKYDQCAFDPNFESMPLSAFEPMVHRLFERPKNSIYLRP